MWAIANDYKIDARDAMDAYYGSGNWTYRTAPHTGSDLGVAVNAMSGWRELVIPPTGTWYMATPITKYAGNHVHGAGGTLGTAIYFDNNINHLISLIGGTPDGGKTGQLTFILESDLGASSGSQIIMWYDANSTGGKAPHSHTFEDLYITAAPSSDGVIRSSWAYALSANGVVDFGIRVCDIKNVQMFCTVYGISIFHAVQWTVSNLGVWVPAQTGGDNVVIENSVGVVGNVAGGTLYVSSSDSGIGLFHRGAVNGTPSTGFAVAI